MKRTLLFILTLLLICGLISCVNVKTDIPSPSSVPEIPSATTVPPTSSLYGSMNVGSSKKLQGNCVFISIFLSDGESSFTEYDKEDQLMSLGSAVTYLLNQAEKYGQTLSIIYNTEDTNIDYAVDYIVPRKFGNTWPYNELISEIYSKYNIDGIMEKYDADNLSFIININKSGRAYASQIAADVEYNEVAIIYRYHFEEDIPAKEISYGRASDYTHELLHLFGAIDLYDLDEERLSLAKEYFPDDIMLKCDVSFEKDVDSLSYLTAYLIGWTDKLDEKYKVFLE